MWTTTTARAARPPHSLLLLVLLGLSAMAPVAPGGKRFDGLTTCAACVDAGFGWSLKKSKCGMFANRDCGGSTAADSSGASAPAAASGGAPAPPPPRSYLGELPIVGAVPRMKWDLSDPNFATTLARRRTPVVLTDSETEDVAMAALALLSTLAKQTKLMKGIVSAEMADVMYRIVRSTESDA